MKQRRRRKLQAQPFPADWLKILEKDVACYRLLSEDDRRELRGHIMVFLDEKEFEGLGGQVIDDQVRVTIAAEACLLLLHRETDYYPQMVSILVYPTSYQGETRRASGGVVQEGAQGRLGESWYRGPVVLAWDEVSRTAHTHPDAHNVVFHEFTHQLDSEDGATDGAPVFPERSMVQAWASVMGQEYEALITEIQRHHQPDIDPYGATNPAEFFAVVTEAFFSKPLPLQRKHPELYAQLQGFYRQDPAARIRTRAANGPQD